MAPSTLPAYDYVVVGGGTAGLVVASRLTEDPSTRVLVVEAGSDHSKNPLVLTPGLVAALYGNAEYDWNFSSVPQVSKQAKHSQNNLPTYLLPIAYCLFIAYVTAHLFMIFSYLGMVRASTIADLMILLLL